MTWIMVRKKVVVFSLIFFFIKTFKFDYFYFYFNNISGGKYSG